MAQRAENEGFRMLDDFVCEAIHDPVTPLAKPENQGRNTGMSVVEEIVFDVLNEGKARGKDKDSPRRTLAVSDVAKPISSGWSRMFSGAAAAAAFPGIVGAVLHVFGAVAGLKEGRDAEKGCQRCDRSDAAYSLRCCHSVVCEGCLSTMFSPQREDAVGFRCAFCGHVHSESPGA
jgi:hypothetical protein